MNSREKFCEILKFNTNIATLKYENGYWGKTIKKWYNEGLPLINYPKIPTKIKNIQASLYTAAWIHEWEKNGRKDGNIELPDGIGVQGGGIYWPTQGFPLDVDVSNYFGNDNPQIMVDIEQLFYPKYNSKIFSDDSGRLTYSDIDGIKRIYLVSEGTLPQAVEWQVKDMESWNILKEERLSLDNINGRFPSDWKDTLEKYEGRDYPLVLGGYPIGIFGILAHLLGYEKLFYSYYDNPLMIKDILNTFVDLWISIWEEVLSQTDVDVFHFWEDMSTGKGPMISEGIFKEFMAPYYKKITGFLKSRGVENILLDTDGNCNQLIPLFMECGITGLYPFEVGAGMDIIDVRKRFPDLQIIGGIDKRKIARGKKEIDETIEIAAEMIKLGGYIPTCDHGVPPDVSWENYKYFRERLNDVIDKKGK